MKKKKKVKISKFEKFLYTLTCFLLLVSPIIIVFTKSTLSEVNYEVEKIKREIASQEKENESLKMKINELASLENIQKVIKDEGLVYNNDSIKNID
ncbi:MAG: cell division protein FtsL [Bacilli bacterium]